MLPFKLVYSEGYDLNLGEHIFPGNKFLWMKQQVLRDRFGTEEDFIEPTPVTEDELRLVHTPEWVKALANGTLSYQQIMKLEIPYSRQMVRGFFLHAGGTTLAGRLALRDRVACNLGGGFHHAFPGHGEGFCAVHDVAVAIRVLQREGLIERALVIDTDVHHGNGTAAIFAGDPTVLTVSIHQYNNYPGVKPPSGIDIHLPDGVRDDEYLAKLERVYIPAVRQFAPQLVFYVAGADPYYEDRLGALGLSFRGLLARDRLVIEAALRAGAGVVTTTAGGYAEMIMDTVNVHVNTIKAAAEALSAVRS
ncbi:MAG: histone deacetylase [Bryobacter sp.]|nr:histone deacetylase [Bryobacter sp.]